MARSTTPVVASPFAFWYSATCELCILDIRAGRLQTTHETATETYTVGSRVWLLCSTHRTEIKYRGRELPCTEP